MCYLAIQKEEEKSGSKSLLPTGGAGCVSISAYVSVLECC